MKAMTNKGMSSVIYECGFPFALEMLMLSSSQSFIDLCEACTRSLTFPLLQHKFMELPTIGIAYFFMLSSNSTTSLMEYCLTWKCTKTSRKYKRRPMRVACFGARSREDQWNPLQNYCSQCSDKREGLNLIDSHVVSLSLWSWKSLAKTLKICMSMKQGTYLKFTNHECFNRNVRMCPYLI